MNCKGEILLPLLKSGRTQDPHSPALTNLCTFRAFNSIRPQILQTTESRWLSHNWCKACFSPSFSLPTPWRRGVCCFSTPFVFLLESKIIAVLLDGLSLSFPSWVEASKGKNNRLVDYFLGRLVKISANELLDTWKYSISSWARTAE